MDEIRYRPNTSHIRYGGGMTSYTHLTHGDRQCLSRLRQARMSIRQMAAVLHRSPSTISRELQRNALGPGHYDVEKAHRKCTQRRHLGKKPTVLLPATIQAIRHLLKKKYSPEQIAYTLTTVGMPISHETIYRYIWSDRRSGGTCYRDLRHALKRRRKRYGRYDSRGRLAGKRMIDERPASVDERRDVGHWEADTVLGRGSRHCIVTLVERKTGYTVIGKLRSRTVEELNARVIALLGNRGDLPLKSITMDNGTEFHGYRMLENKLHIPNAIRLRR